MSQTFKLFRLQQVDIQIDRARHHIGEIEKALCENEALREAQARFEQTVSILQENKEILQRAEREVDDQRIKIEQTEAALYGGKVRNPKELQDLQNEAASLKKYRDVLVDRQLESMIAVEEIEGEYEQAKAALEAVQAEMEKQHGNLTEEKKSLESEVARLESERLATASSIPPNDMSLYEKLRSQRRGIAVAKVTPDRACSACGSTLNAALLHASRSPNQITLCDTCGRILYGG